MDAMVEQAYRFHTATPVYCERYGNGHINETYLMLDSGARLYILQKINQRVFRNPKLLMQNVSSVCAHIKQSADSHREYMTLVPDKSGSLWHVDDYGEYWRLYEFISDSMCMEWVEIPNDFRESALAFGRFQRRLADFNATSLHETIPRFHDTPNRYALLHKAIDADAFGRAKSVAAEIDFALEREEYGSKLKQLHAAGDIPTRVTHNDTKLNNILYDRNTRKALCVIDLDTVMPGLVVHDFGDSIRFGATTAVEDERDLSKVSFSLELYHAYMDGYLFACGDALTPLERELLRDGAKMMTLECGIRFLTDYLSGDTYFRISRESQNLDRTRTQFKLIADMEKVWEELRAV